MGLTIADTWIMAKPDGAKLKSCACCLYFQKYFPFLNYIFIFAKVRQTKTYASSSGQYITL